MLKRKVDLYLKKWLENRKQALLITGARQIGKSFSMIKFINENFKNAIIVNFASLPKLVENFAFFEEPNDLLTRLSLIAGDKLVPHETAIFFDEIQILYQKRDEKPDLKSKTIDLITAMKELVTKGEYRFILSGSLLGVTIKDITLMPVGYLDEYKMYPLDFEEFLWAKGVGEKTFQYVKKCFIDKTKVDELVHQTLLKYFREYILIGGMPEAVETYINTSNLYLLKEVQDQIIGRYLADVVTYIKDENLKLRIKDIYKSIPSQLSSKNMRFISSQVIDNRYLKHNIINDEFLWLSASGLAICVYNVDEPVIPLGLTKNRKILKLFANDIGLFTAQLADTDIREKLLNNEKEINYGAPYENAVAMELIAHGFDGEIYYYNSKKHGEVDFLITYKNEVLPIEIKSGKNHDNVLYNHRALNNLIKMYDYSLAYVFGESNVTKENDKIWQLPIYMIDFIRKNIPYS